MASIERRIELDGKPFAYTHKVSIRAKRLRLTVHRGGFLVATAPLGISAGVVESFILRKSRWVIESIDRLKGLSSHIKSSRADFLKHKDEARRLVEGKISKLNGIYGFRIGRISIKDQKTRWGSCSSKGNLNFNYRIGRLPDHLAEYIVAHELCHIGELNHSPRFWALVEKAVPRYHEARKELSRSGLEPR